MTLIEKITILEKSCAHGYSFFGGTASARETKISTPYDLARVFHMASDALHESWDAIRNHAPCAAHEPTDDHIVYAVGGREFRTHRGAAWVAGRERKEIEVRRRDVGSLKRRVRDADYMRDHIAMALAAWDVYASVIAALGGTPQRQCICGPTADSSGRYLQGISWYRGERTDSCEIANADLRNILDTRGQLFPAAPANGVKP